MSANVHLIILDLFLPQQFAASACSGLSLPALEKLLARSRREPMAAQSHKGTMSLEARLCAHFGVMDESVAPITLQADGMQAEGFYWLRADPVHLQLQRAQMNLHANVSLSVDEATRLCDSLNQHFAGEHFKFFAPHPQRWYMRLDAAPDLMTYSLMQVAGKDIRPCMPFGADALYWNGVMNEVQMLLHEHAVNTAREARGEVVINSVWLWGGGFAQILSQRPFARVVGDSLLPRAFAEYAGISYFNLPDDERWLADTSSEILVVWEGQRLAIQQGNVQAWQDAVLNLEQFCAAPLLNALGSGEVARVSVEVLHGSASHRFILSRGDLWKVWRTRVSLAHYALQ
ncbi:MAG: hypothetical protein ABL860_05860 [Candidatus Nitrotoga sp.]